MVRKILTEGTHYDKKAVKLIVDSGLFDEETAEKIIDALFKEDIHAFVHSPAWLEKYLVGIARMLVEYSNGSKQKAQEFLTECPAVFEKYLTWVKENREKIGAQVLDKKFNEEMTYQQVKDELEKIQDELDKQSSDELSKMKFDSSSNYELVPINSYSEFNRLFGGRATGDGSSDKYAGGGGTAWCHTNSESTYNSWVQNGKYKFFVLANKNWKSIPFDINSNSKNPKDTYGNSLIAILVNTKTGRLEKSTLRCNHVGVSSTADNQYSTYSELSKIAGFNVEEKVKEELKDTLVDTSDIKNLYKTFDGTAESLDNILEILETSAEELTEFEIPYGVTSIGYEAFYYCTGLTSVTIPDSVTSIGYEAFCYCTGLTSITIPDSVTSIGNSVFYGCTGLTSITIPDSVTSIGLYAFYNCTGLTSVTIGNSVTSIGEYAFLYCIGLTSVIIPDSVTSIGNDAFRSCTGLTSVTIGNGVTSIGDDAFYGCTGLTSVTIPDSVTSICGYAFRDCTGLKSITIPNSVTSIGYYAFSGCNNLTITCSKNSYAYRYAQENDIPVKLLNENFIMTNESMIKENILSDKYILCPNCLTKTLYKPLKTDTIYICDNCENEYNGEETNSGLKLIELGDTKIDESISVTEDTEKYKTYTIKKTSDTDEYEVITPDGISDATFETVQQAKNWIDNKTSNSAEIEIHNIFPKAKKLSYSLIDKYITYGGQEKLDKDNTYLVKFSTKRERQQADKLAKSKGFIVVEHTDDDYSYTKKPFWSFYSISDNDKWLNTDVIESLTKQMSKLIGESLEIPKGNPIQNVQFGCLNICLEAKYDTDLKANSYVVAGYKSMVCISEKKLKTLEEAEKVFKQLKNKLNALKDINSDDYMDALQKNFDKAEKIVNGIGKLKLERFT